MSTFKFIVICWIPIVAMLLVSKGLPFLPVFIGTIIVFLAALHWAGIKPTKP